MVITFTLFNIQFIIIIIFITFRILIFSDVSVTSLIKKIIL